MILVTGGAGYIGSHVCLELLAAGQAVAVLDNLCNASLEPLRRVERLSGRKLVFVEGDIRDGPAVAALLRAHDITAVIHLAGLKSVAESSISPLSYYDANVTGTAQLLMTMAAHSLKRIVFSSSATVYGLPQTLPVTEQHPCVPINPYGRTKLIIEDMLSDIVRSDAAWQIGVLRYFNPIGAHDSGLIGEDPAGTPNNLVPYLAQVAVGRRPSLTIFGEDYPTSDGTGIRDYIHVVDLAQAHVRALEHLSDQAHFTVNIGTGRGYTVREMVGAFEAASGCSIPCVVGPPREGDVAACYADTSAAERILTWRATRTLDAMCVDHWRWQKTNPDGYATPLHD
jgi:UDP-glucose 4-epimerase